MKVIAGLFGVVALAAVAFPVATPAYALGGCGPNYHRNAYGRCVWGGQNENWCVRTTGHRSVRMPNGTYRCFR